MKCKKSIMGLAAILIVIFHFWIPVSSSPVETNIYKCTYIGVDLFFFVSAYSMAHKKEIEYGSFLKNRLVNIYLPFAVMAIICAIYKSWSIKRLLLVLCGAEFFKKGGGSFLWFAIAIMLLYLIAPLFIKLKNKLGIKALPLLLTGFAGLVCILQFGFHYTDIFILLNRIPIFLIGLYYEEIRKLNFKKWDLPLIILLLAGGGYLLYNYGGNVRLNKPVTDMYYIIAVPFTLGIVAMFDYISQKTSLRNIPLIFIGGFTLELYGMQMIFGFDIETAILKKMLKGSSSLTLEAKKILSFLLTLLCLILIAYIFHLAKYFIIKIFNFKEKKRK